MWRCTKTGFSAFNKWWKWKFAPCILVECSLTSKQHVDGGRWIQNSFSNNSSQWHPLAPDDLLKLVRYSYSSKIPCKTHIFGCNNASLICSVFCACQDDRRCFNERTSQYLLGRWWWRQSLTWTQDKHNNIFINLPIPNEPLSRSSNCAIPI